MAKYFPSPNTRLKHGKIQICIFSLGAVYSLDFDPIEGANIESEAGKDRNPIAWRSRIKKGVHYGYRVRYCFAPGASYSPRL